ncbi:transglutaminase domain-containing protein [Streptomyces yokosukanensis]|uniref:transglutaminase domain-containing protein n=1 Tax=Streptomyces yokosukanensis TaxID=67386 RepID=UPI00099E346B|nr:transglutaminase domain-containing protein [Streptomyces yokosukanensis]
MTSSLLMPRGRGRAGTAGGETAAGGTNPTRILDWRHPRVRALLRQLDVEAEPRGTSDPAHRLTVLRRAHRWIAAAVRPVYSVQDERPVSEVLRRGRGSCSQRLAVLESVARASGVATRVRGLSVDGAFWYPRFPRLRRIVPHHVVLAWPEFRLEGLSETGHPTAPWLPVSELFGTLAELGEDHGGGFTNAGPETLFDALSRTAIDWDGATVCSAAAGTTCDLSASVVADLGHFASRDDLFARHGQTLCGTARLLAEPVLGRRSAGGTTVAQPRVPPGSLILDARRVIKRGSR